MAKDPVQEAWDLLAQGAPKRPDYARWVRQFDAHKSPKRGKRKKK